MSHIRVSRGAVALVAALAGGVAFATSAPQLSLSERAQKSDRVVVAKVTGVREQQLSCPPGAPCLGALSVATLTVTENVKGSGANVVEVALPAHADIAGAAHFDVGDRALVFLRCFRSEQAVAARAKLNDTVAPGAERCALYGFADAKLEIVKQGTSDAVLIPTGLHTSAARALRDVKSELAAAIRGTPVATSRADANAPVMSIAPHPADAKRRVPAIDATGSAIPAPAAKSQTGGAP